MTYDEYIDRVSSLTADQIKNGVVNSDKVTGFKNVLINTYILIAIEVLVCFILFLLYRSERKVAFDVLLGLGTLFAIAFEIGSALYY